MILGASTEWNEFQLEDCVKQAISYNADTFMFYSGEPTTSIRRTIKPEATRSALKLMLENDIDINNVICHAGFLINLANKDEQKWDFSINFLKKEIDRANELGVTKLVLHPGSSVKYSKEEGLQNIIDGLNIVIKESDKVMILLETMSGKGTERASTIEEMATIFNGLKYPNKAGVCLDTCHIHDAGYDLVKFDEYLDKFDSLIGLKHIKCIHINDSKNDKGSHKDRHENYGFGTIGFETLLKISQNPKLKDVPQILETPWINDKPPYKTEIQMIRDKKFNNSIRNLEI